MLKFRIVAVGKDKDAWLTEGCAHYEKLLRRWAEVKWVYPAAAKTSASLSPGEIRRREAEAILPRIEGAFTVALADRGQAMDSPTLAGRLSQWQVRGGGRIVLIVGGPYGLDNAVLDRADFVWSLSPLTFSHQVVRLVLLEQLFRALSIQHNTDYHK